MYKQSMEQFLRLLLVIAAVIGIGVILKFAIVYLYPFALAILLSLVLNPFVTFLENKVKIPRSFATLLVILTVFIIIIGSITLIISEIIQGTAYLAEQLPVHFQSFITYIENFVNTKIVPFYHHLTSFFHSLDPAQQESVKQNIQQLTSRIATSGTEILQTFLLTIPSIISLLPSSMTVFIFIILGTFFITKDWFSIQQSIKKIIPSFTTNSSKSVWDHLKRALFGFLRAQLILISITSCTILVGLLILQVDHALTIALIAAIVDLLPLIGTGIIFIPWIVYLFITSNFSLTIGMSILYMLIVIVRQILEPKILSSSIGLNPLLTLIAIFLGMQLWGIIGLIIAPFLLVALNAFYQSGLFKQMWLFIKG